MDEIGQLATQYQREINRSGDNDIMSRWESRNGVEITPYEEMDIDSFKKAVEGIDECYIEELEKKNYNKAREQLYAFRLSLIHI